MTDQTKWNIDQIQTGNKAKTYQEQKEMRDDVSFFVFNCSVFDLQKMYKEMNRLKNEKNNS